MFCLNFFYSISFKKFYLFQLALSTRMIERIFSGAVTRGNGKNSTEIRQGEGKMSYTEFVWFLLSEEDKNHPTAIEYWFRY